MTGDPLPGALSTLRSLPGTVDAPAVDGVVAASAPPLPSPPVLAAAGGAEAVSVGPLRAAVVLLLVAIGVFFLLVGTVGLLRLPTVYNRMHATSKATTLGAGVIALAGFVLFGLDPAAPGGDGLIALVTVLLLFVTAPTGAHLISRAAQRMGVPFTEGVDWPGGGEGTPPQPADGDAPDVDVDGEEGDGATPADDD
jgi:multicomponent Na+:H+ antiporter subunit G